MRRKTVAVLTIFISLIIILVLLPAIMSNNQKEQPAVPKTSFTSPTTPQPTNLTPTPTATAEPTKKAEETFFDQLPYFGTGFVVEYFPSSDKFLVTITKNPFNQYKSLAKEWFTKNGLDPETLNITWSFSLTE